jgi:hypothetical protein
MDICFRSKYWHLQPRYIKQEMWAGPLHFYNSAFICGYILHRVEMPQKQAVVPVAQEAKDKSAGDSLKLDLKSRINNTRIHDYLASTV